jgi:hypothetical protein
MDVQAYEGTDGDVIVNPELAVVQDCLRRDDDYWEGGSGSAYIGTVRLLDPGYTTLFDRPCFHIMVHRPYGVALTYQRGGDVRMTYQDSLPDDQLIIHYLGGQPACIPLRCFVPEQAAVNAIAQFLNAEQLPACVEWRRRKEASFDGYRVGAAD